MLIQCEEFATPEAVLALDKEQLRGVGLSYAKVCAKEELLEAQFWVELSEKLEHNVLS